jgi:RNA polymerase sigma-70 factor, ECF subfamily
VDEQTLLRAASDGDRRAFDELVRVRRRELHAHCYRMLGSADDADDAVQETMLRAWKGLGAFEHRSSVRTWLYRIATNASLDISGRRSRRELPVDFGPSSHEGAPGDAHVEVPWIGPYVTASPRVAPDVATETRESVELAYIAALQYLPPNQRAAYLLCEALDFSAADAAATLNTTVAAVNSALQRARRAVRDRLPATSQREELARLGDDAVRDLASRYAHAIETADITALLALLTVDATWSMPPIASWYRGHRDVARFLTTTVFAERWRHTVTWANDQLAVAGYIYDTDRDCFVACALDVLDLEGGLIRSVTGFLTIEGLTAEERALYRASDHLFRDWQLPDRLAV